MSPPPFERRWRDALLDAVLPAPGPSWPEPSTLDRAGFWERFEASAPLELRVGVRVATWVLAALAPLVLAGGRTLDRLPEERRDALLERLDRFPLTGALVEIVKVLACFAYFDDAGVQVRVRGGTR